MAETKLVDLLQNLGFLEGIAGPDLEQLASYAERVEFAEGQQIFREGEPAQHVYLIISGRVALEVCAPAVGCRRILTVGPGELLGWSPVLQQPRLTATARTLAATQSLRIPASRILKLCEDNPSFGYAFMQRVALALAKRLRAARLQLLDVYGVESPAAPPASTD
ncbi:MAG: cyclic nucleotide-binding domain-containing protein [Planctomycetales bacterium]|nr:cyclic nucleotide-binding domain-containing protein [Planctomycetales bacterium]NIM08877.1 cyclic nucleotide-binding domain-containing protein [Planctomycetales bacterium]NIN08337.1 cyclic nucleotide-binding domain-containing protein [Planctomycetales bacterium]NIN77465.1 cyclic nucleotide-binding domain-containing protein [Planctomycetales bacterium]NIO34637.1 cyclic nucleotide-binding domain-containing protein [Planctomycetales bacterium]